VAVSITGTPDPQTVYRDAQGRVLTYVRTEQRDGRTTPEHLFLTTRERNVFQLWSETVPEEAELILDVEGRKQANEANWLLQAADHDRELALGLLKRACEWLPQERAQELRAQWKEAQP
jgi:hypothetical protein